MSQKQRIRQLHVAVTEEFNTEFEEACRRLNFATKSEALRSLMRRLIEESHGASCRRKGLKSR